QVAIGARHQRIERPTRRQHQFMALAQRIDPGIVEPHDRASVRAIAESLAVTASNIDLIADGDIAQATEMRIAVGSVDDHTALTGIGRQFDMTRTEGESLSATAFEHDGAGMDALHLDTGDRPGTRPTPWFCYTP